MSEKILMVDDDQLILDCFGRLLSSRFDVETACGPEAALAAVSARGPFAVMVTDLRMPGLDGVQLLKRVKEISSGTVGIVLSGNADMTDPQLVENPAIFRILDKPCPSATLIAVLNDALKHRHRRKEPQEAQEAQ
jgi:DNA-binding NtrC family response regulator